MKSSICMTTIFTLALSGLALAATQVPQAETSAGPAAAEFNGTTYIAWAGFHEHPEGYHVAYTTIGGTQTVFDFYTTVAPALAAARGTLYLASRGNAPAPAADAIYYSTVSGTALQPPSLAIPGAETTASPALAGDSATLFAAWTTTSGKVQYSFYNGSWNGPYATPAVTDTQIAPALAVYNGELFLVWVKSGTSQLMYATLPIASQSWSAASPLGQAQTNVAATLGVYNAVSDARSGLYVAWIDGGDVNYSEYQASSGIWIPGPIPPGPLSTSFAPALSMSFLGCEAGLTGGINEFNLFFSEPDSDIYYQLLLMSGKCHVIIPCKGTTCQ